MSSSLRDKPFIVVDMNSGRWILTKTGHEHYNMIPNDDGKYYGYCPPYGNVDISNLGAKIGESCVSNILVIYTQKLKGTSNRVVIGFTDKATVFRKNIVNPSLNRKIYQDGKIVDCGYCIVSDYLYNLESETDKFIIDISKYSINMFRMQRFYKGKYPELDKALLDYLEHYLARCQEEDSLMFQSRIQEEDTSKLRIPENTSQREPQYISSSHGKAVNKSVKISKAALCRADYKCSFNECHTTFETAKGVPYMEGHHLIPCTYDNAEHYWKAKQRNIDCLENIICLCPTCHRQIHFGSKEEKETIIQRLYDRHRDSLVAAGLDISIKELLALYHIGQNENRQ